MNEQLIIRTQQQYDKATTNHLRDNEFQKPLQINDTINQIKPIMLHDLKTYTNITINDHASIKLPYHNITHRYYSNKIS